MVEQKTETVIEVTEPKREVRMPTQQPIQNNYYDINVLEKNPETGGIMKTPQMHVPARNRAELIALYAACDQHIEILREYPGGSQGGQSMQFTGDLPPLTEAEAKAQGIKLLPMPENAPLPPPNWNKQQFAQPQIQQPPSPPPKPKDRQPPKYFSIGGIECKQDHGVIFQKQWVRVDGKNFRLISDSSNKELPLTGKHIETLKWVAVEDAALLQPEDVTEYEGE